MNDPQRIVVLTHGKFPGCMKTVTGVLEYVDYDVVAALGHDNPGTIAADHRRDLPDVPVVASMADAPDADVLLVGTSPIDGAFDEIWCDDVHTALERGCDLISGPHYFLAEGEEFTRLADGHGRDINGVRKLHDDLGAMQGEPTDVDAEVIPTVDIDCSVGKMTATLELVEVACRRGIGTGFILTGQTSIMIAGWGNPVDRVVNDFTTGTIEEMILEKGNEHNMLPVKGQGSIVHPAYSAVTCSILHGAMADKFVPCHKAIREAIHDYEEFVLLDLSEYVSPYENLVGPTHEVGMAVGMPNTSRVNDDVKVAEAIDAFTNESGVPAVDPARFGSVDLIDGVFQILTTEFELVSMPLAEPFGTACGVQIEVENVVVHIEDEGDMTGVGVTAPLSYYGEAADTVEAVLPNLLSMAGAVGDAHAIDRIEREMAKTVHRNPAARTVVSIALHDLAAKRFDVLLYHLWGLDPSRTPTPSCTIGLNDLDTMCKKIAKAYETGYGVLKVKPDTDHGRAIIGAVRDETPGTAIRVDVSEVWTPREAVEMAELLADHGVEFAEQLVPAGDHEGLKFVYDCGVLPIATDEFCITATDIPCIADRVDIANPKLMKYDGLTEAKRVIHTVRAHELKVILGCTVESNAAVAAGCHLAPLLDYADFGGSLFLTDDLYEGVPMPSGEIDPDTLGRSRTST